MSEELIQDLLAGRVDPFVVATQRVRKGLVSAAAVVALYESIRSFVETGVFISSELGTSIFSDGSNLAKIAARLARYNYHAATLVSTDADLIADVAFTHFQLLGVLPQNLEECRRLIGEFHPAFRARGASPLILFHACLGAVNVYWASTRFDKKHFHDLVQFGLEALRHAEALGVQRSHELCQLHFRLGVALNEIGSANVEQLERSITFLRQCIADEQHCRERFLGSALNSLGYSLLLLGRLKHDRQIFMSAIDTFKEALPYRVGQEIDLTRTNLADAERALAAGPVAGTAAAADSFDSRIKPAKDIFNEILSGQMEGPEREELLRTAMNHLLDLTPTPDVAAEPALRARLELALGVGLVCSGAPAVAICFLRAAARTWDALSGEDLLPRRAAAYYNLGLAFSMLQGLRDENFYTGRAIASFERAMDIFTAAGLEERSQMCAKFVERLRSRP